MNIELMPGLENVIRFPVEERVKPSIMLLHEIEPDVREVSLIADSFRLNDLDDGMRHRTDEETALYIAEQILPASPEELKKQLDALLDPVVKRAVDACRAAHAAAQKAMTAEKEAHAAKLAGAISLRPIEDHARILTEQAARMLVEAHNRAEEAHGVNRAVQFARDRESWRPFDINEESERWLLGIAPAANSRPHTA